MSTPLSFEQAKALFIEGLAQLEAGHLAVAEQRFQASLALLPGRVSTLVNLAAVQLKLSRPDAALASADQALAVEPGSRDALFHRGNALLELSQPAQALQAFEQLLTVDPTLAPVWSTRGDILREMGRLDEATHAYRQALARGADAALTSYYLAALEHRDAPVTAPRAYVEGLFDGYAGQFEQHVVQVLHYRAPELLTQPLKSLHAGRFRSALDLGCGTGLCGPLVKPLADRLVGVDVSSRMLEKAAERQVYDQLVHADVAEHLRMTDEPHDLVIAADVFIYIGELAPIFESVSRRMDAGGVFCFSAELPNDESTGFELLTSLRYAHSTRYLRGLAAQHGFEVKGVSQAPIREDQRQAVDGLFVHLVRA